MLDEIINYIHVWADGGSSVFDMYNNFTQLNFPHAKLLTLGKCIYIYLKFIF
jgi:hypothetical protein